MNSHNMVLAGLVFTISLGGPWGGTGLADPPPVNFANVVPAVTHYGITPELSRASPYQGGYYSGAYPAPPPLPPPGERAEAQIMVRVPKDAIVWFDGAQARQGGELRRFITPPLPTDRTFTYVMRARWIEAGKVYDRSYKVRFQPGTRFLVNFTRPPPTVEPSIQTISDTVTPAPAP